MKAPHLVFQHIAHYSSARSAKPSSNSTPSCLQRWFEQFFQWLMVSERIKITQKCDRTGHTYYQIDDRLSGQTNVFLSEEDTIAWLDQKRF
jgi:hypothetical protein